MKEERETGRDTIHNLKNFISCHRPLTCRKGELMDTKLRGWSFFRMRNERRCFPGVITFSPFLSIHLFLSLSPFPSSLSFPLDGVGSPLIPGSWWIYIKARCKLVLLDFLRQWEDKGVWNIGVCQHRPIQTLTRPYAEPSILYFLSVNFPWLNLRLE